MSSQFKVRDPDEKIIAAFRRYVIQKHGKLYGNVTKEFNNFIKQGLALADFEDYSTKVSFLTGPEGLQVEESPAHKKLTKKERTIIRAFEKDLNSSNKITNDELIIFLKSTMGEDDRTVLTWTKYLERIGFIRKDSLLYWTNTAPLVVYDAFPELAPARVRDE
jgi:hypothetical protein